MFAKPMATVRGRLQDDKFYVPLVVNGVQVPGMVFDTGAFGFIFSGRVAKLLNLPRLGRVNLRGIGGTTAAYRSKCTIQIGHRTYSNVQCIVVPRLSYDGLFGLRFFITHRLKVELDPVSQTLTIRKAASDRLPLFERSVRNRPKTAWKPTTKT
ncbi:retroviral-like aspartic protease family protein [Alicyclobacillus tolerans]|uniref:retropepsin-like aspartic protease n=1 Tax=Alicyclobacillus tolerans TaxID=90970 RepID=UPI001F1695DF|nr:retropepsin-like aspartic protease [Alicyclobacillus tolerans]MCF8565871.1 retroviral-like aspartic protease family protein [Alicyclobacillus tolerans]